MRRLRHLDYMSIILALIVAGGLAGWAASVAVNYFEADAPIPAQQQSVEPEWRAPGAARRMPPARSLVRAEAEAGNGARRDGRISRAAQAGRPGERTPGPRGSCKNRAAGKVQAGM